MVLLRVEHLEQGGRRVTAKIHRHLVHFIEHEQGVTCLYLGHVLDDLAGHRTDIGAPMTTNLCLIAHAAQGHANELTVRRPRDRLPERRFSHPRRPDKTQDRPLDLIDPLLDREILENAFLNFFQAVVVRLENALGGGQVLAHPGPLLPRHIHEPIDVVAHHRGFRRHRRHHLQFAQFGIRFLARLFRHARLLDPGGQFFGLVGRLFELTEFLLDSLHLFVQIILALTLLHLFLHAAANTLLDFHQIDLGIHDTEDMLKPHAGLFHFEDRLLLLDLQVQVRRDRICKTTWVVDTAH